MNDSTISNNIKLVVITGGPGAGKTAVLEMARKCIENSTAILPEAASIIFGGGFWRLPSQTAKMAAQRAIFHVQRELENLVCQENKWNFALCDRGTLDGLAYWQEAESEFWKMSDSSLEKELKRYHAVIHLRSPSLTHGFNNINPLRTETAEQSKIIDERIATIWKQHPRYISIPSDVLFITKAQKALDLISQFHSEHC
jgi:predicted ATPase